MDAKQASNLFLLARHMEGVTREINMDKIHDCGTPCCVMGEAGIMPTFIRQGIELLSTGGWLFRSKCCGVDDVGAELFGLSEAESLSLFATAHKNRWGGNPTGKEWADAAFRVLAEHGYSSDPAIGWNPHPKCCRGGEQTSDCANCDFNGIPDIVPAGIESTRAFCARMAEVELREEAETY